METQMEMEQERLSRRQQAATSRHLKIMLQTFWHVAQVRVSKIGPCKRFNSPAAASEAASEAATRCDAMRCDLTALRGCTSFGWQSATTNWRSRFSCTTCKFIATVALSLPSGGASASAPASAPVPSQLLCRQRLCFGLLCICVSVSVSITIKPGCQTEETLLK